MSAKVRIACRRCRTKRIKCDGGFPACGNCQKVGEPCIDVDGRNKALSIPRDFAANARARIEWLEELIKKASPELDLTDGPRVDFSFLDAAGVAIQPAAPSPGSRDTVEPGQAPSPETGSVRGKRTFSSIAEPPAQDGFADEARSVALDLGLLTLNSDSRQTHYLGTSSGRLFSSLIGAGSPGTTSHASSNRTPSVLSFPSPGKLGPVAHAKHMKESCRMVYETLRKSLPSEEDARILLDVYFRDIHVDHPFLHPDSLMSAVEALYQCAASDSTTEISYNGWVETIEPFPYNGEFARSRNSNCTPVSVFTATFHVFMVFTLAATVRTRQRSYDFAPKQFHRVAMSISQQCFSNISVSSLQATLLLAVYSLLSPAELNIWTLIYVAMAHCVDLGLHRSTNGNGNLSEAAQLTRKLVFFTVYHLDRSIAAIQGRPLGIRDETFDLQLPTLQDIQADTASIQDRNFAPEMALSGGLAFAVHRFKLDPIISEIKLLFYHLPSQVSTYAWPSDHNSSQTAIRQKLEQWRRDLSSIASSVPRELDDDGSDLHKYELKLISQYFAAMILLHQPSQVMPQPTEQSLLICYQCAASRLNTYNELYHADNFYQSWRSVQGIFSSGATMIYCIWTSNVVRNTISISDAIRDLRTCTNLLSVGGEWWPSVKKGKESFGRAMDALLKKLNSTQRHVQSAYEVTPNEPPAIRQNRNFAPTRNEAASFMASESSTEAAHNTFEMHTPSQGEGGRVPNFFHTSSEFETTDWNILENHPIDHNFANHPGSFFDEGLEASDSTVEAFIAEFLSNETAWNPF